MNVEQILEYLVVVSNKYLEVNVILHLLVIGTIIATIGTKNDKCRTLAIDLTVALLSISVVVVALINGNYFHMMVFLLLAIFSVIEVLQRKNNYIQLKLDIQTCCAFIIIAMGLWYPEFVVVGKLQSLLFSPMGIVPCPTLLVILGLTCLAKSATCKKQQIIILLLGMLFGTIGTFKFKVHLDLSLLLAETYGIFIFIKGGL